MSLADVSHCYLHLYEKRIFVRRFYIHKKAKEQYILRKEYIFLSQNTKSSLDK